MAYRNINIDDDDLRYIENNKKIRGVKLQDFVNTAIKQYRKELEDAAEFLRKRREKQIQELSKKL